MPGMECDMTTREKKGMSVQRKKNNENSLAQLLLFTGGTHLLIQQGPLRVAHAEHHKDSYCRLQETRDRSAGRGLSVVHS